MLNNGKKANSEKNGLFEGNNMLNKNTQENSGIWHVKKNFGYTFKLSMHLLLLRGSLMVVK